MQKRHRPRIASKKKFNPEDYVKVASTSFTPSEKAQMLGKAVLRPFNFKVLNDYRERKFKREIRQIFSEAANR